jgi:catechol 2,3-dioxygenase-like lactoylglutathione lyase family enzyme
MLDHATVRTLDLEGTCAFLEAVLGRKLGEQTEGKARRSRI